jgi:hypothetical protein
MGVSFPDYPPVRLGLNPQSKIDRLWKILELIRI